MQSAFIVKDKTGKPYAVVSILSGGTNFYPIAESATNWSSWMEDEYAARAITKQQLIATLDNSMDIEGPLSYNRVNKVKIDELIGKAKKVPATEPIETAKEQKSELVPVLSLLDVRIDNLGNDEWRNAVEFKAKSFIADVNKATFSYEVKRTRAAWDPTLAVPGTDRQGGWRCPPGTRYGGQITDRFGRNCGWGASRRIANEISDLGERLENVGERRRERRVVRRNERMVRRLQQGGAVERAAGRVANVLDVTGRDNGPVAGKPRGAGLIERVAGRVAGALETDNNTGRQRRQQGQNRQQPGLLERAAGRAARALETDSGRTPPRRPRPQAPRAPQARPARPRQPRRLPNAVRNENIVNVPVPAGRPNRNESLEAYKTRKYNEHQQRVREINLAGGNAGLLRRSEWEKFHGPTVEDNWNRLQEQNGGRAARRAATGAPAARVANRRPKATDVPDAVQPARRQRLPFVPYGHQRGLQSEAAGWRKFDAINNDPNNMEMRELHLVELNGKFYVVNGPDELDKAEQAGAEKKARQNIAIERPLREPAVLNITPPSEVIATSRAKRSPVNGVGAKKKSNDAKVGKIGEDGLPSAKRIEIGNAGISTKEDAIRHITDGGPLSDVPDEFLKDALLGNTGQGKRYSVEIKNGGINGAIRIYTDSTSGKKYILKYDGNRYKHNEDLNEIVGNNIAARMGVAVGEFRFAGPEFRDRNGQGRPILFEHVENYVDGVAVRRPTHQEVSKIQAEDKILATLLDFSIINIDRHAGNFFIAKNGREVRFVPIDPSLGFNASGNWGSDLATARGMRQWLNSSRGGGKNTMLVRLREDINSGRVTRDSAIRAIEKIQESLRVSENKNPFVGFVNEAISAAGGVEERVNTTPQSEGANQRLKFLMDTSSTDLFDIIKG